MNSLHLDISILVFVDCNKLIFSMSIPCIVWQIESLFSSEIESVRSKARFLLPFPCLTCYEASVQPA